mgnify:CR=1 FL=1|jgi:hypothetical protein|nr:MAG TPA_asm: hypothetical protein [Caudoviricetes sp.]
MDNNNSPLSIIIENARGKLIQAFNEVLAETKLPAYLTEGIILEILSEVRSRKNLELVSDYNRVNQNTEKEE